jgi:hypothetical protein
MQLTGEEIRVRGLAALRRELGRAGLARFLQHFKAGNGDYTQARRGHLATLTMRELRERAERSKRKRARRTTRKKAS